MRTLSRLSRIWGRRRGLTLIEILVVSVIFSIIAVSLFIVFKAGLDSWRKTQAHLEVYQAARNTLDMMTRDISAAYLNSANASITFRGFDGASGWRTNSARDEVYCISALNPTLNDPNAKFELCKVGYWVDGKGTGNIDDDELMRYYYAQTGATPDYDFSSASTNFVNSKIASRITGLNITYFDSAGTERTSWDSTSATEPLMQNKKPTKVNIAITVRDTTSGKDIPFTTGVFIPQ